VQVTAVGNCGALVGAVDPTGPAAMAGIQAGDVIVAADGMALSALPASATSGGTTGGSAGGAATSAAGGTTGGAATSAAGGTTGGSAGGVQEVTVTVTLGTAPSGGSTTGGSSAQRLQQLVERPVAQRRRQPPQADPPGDEQYLVKLLSLGRGGGFVGIVCRRGGGAERGTGPAPAKTPLTLANT